MSTTLLNNSELLVYLLNRIPYGVVMCNADYEIVLWNKWAEDLIGTSPENVNEGKWKREGKFFTRDGRELQEQDRALYRAVKTEQDTSSKTIVRFADRDIYLETDASPLYDDNHKLIGGVAFFKDVTNNIKIASMIDKAIEDVKNIQSYLSKYAIA